jgi:hypothetical protein
VVNLLPFFSKAGFEKGMITDIPMGDRQPIGTVQLKWGQWWKVYAVDVNSLYGPVPQNLPFNTLREQNARSGRELFWKRDMTYRA